MGRGRSGPPEGQQKACAGRCDAIKSLIESKLSGPKRRNRAEIREVRFDDIKGQLKSAGDKSTLDPSFKGLDHQAYDRLATAIDTALGRSPADRTRST